LAALKFGPYLDSVPLSLRTWPCAASPFPNLTLARIALSRFLLALLCRMHPSWHRDESHAVPFRTACENMLPVSHLVAASSRNRGKTSHLRVTREESPQSHPSTLQHQPTNPYSLADSFVSFHGAFFCNTAIRWRPDSGIPIFPPKTISRVCGHTHLTVADGYLGGIEARRSEV
jgi:hypothetical protein